MTDDLIECYKNSKKLMPFVHLPIQSGSDRILKMMNRKHTVNYYLNIYEKLIKINPDIKFSSDFIIGYPGETDSDFKETINLVNKIKFINSFSFIFSPRPGTKAAELEITDKDKLKNRLITIQEKLFSNQIELNKSLEGKTLEVLVENKLKNQNKFFVFKISLSFKNYVEHRFTNCLNRVFKYFKVLEFIKIYRISWKFLH